MDYRRFHLPQFGSVSRRDYLLALLSGLLLIMPSSSGAFWPLAWIAFVPLFLACGKKTVRQTFRLAFISGLTACCGIFYWVNIVMVRYGHLPAAVSFVLFLLLSAYVGLYLAGAFALTRWGEERGVSPLFFFPAVWTALELLRAFFLTGFPWMLLGYTQYRLVPLIQIADIAGVYGVSFLVAFGNIIIYRLLRRAVRGRKYTWPRKSLVFFLLLTVGSISYGYRKLHLPETGKTLRVALVQGNIDQGVKWNPEFLETTLQTYEKLSRQACTTGADLVVWPESAAPFYLQEEKALTARLQKLAKESSSCYVVGSPAVEMQGGLTRYLNSAFLLGPTGDIIGRSDKIHLVPFGEYVPLARLFPFVHKMVQGIGDFSSGLRITTLNTGKADIGILICYEGIFPELSRGYVVAGSRLLVNITNDAWFGRSTAPYQHLAMTAFRAVENRVPLVRSANTGISAVIDSKGRILQTSPLFREAVVSASVTLAGDTRTPYTKYGDLFAYGCSGATILLLAVSFFRRRAS